MSFKLNVLCRSSHNDVAHYKIHLDDGLRLRSLSRIMNPTRLDQRHQPGVQWFYLCKNKANTGYLMRLKPLSCMLVSVVVISVIDVVGVVVTEVVFGVIVTEVVFGVIVPDVVVSVVVSDVLFSVVVSCTGSGGSCGGGGSGSSGAAMVAAAK